MSKDIIYSCDDTKKNYINGVVYSDKVKEILSRPSDNFDLTFRISKQEDGIFTFTLVCPSFEDCDVYT